MLRFLLPLVACASLVRANDTAVNAGDSGPSPLGEIKGEESVIRMVSEKIDITFGKDESKVYCRFVFRSTKEGADARQTVGFPDFLSGDDRSDQGSITSMTTKVDGVEVPAKLQEGYFSGGRGTLGKPAESDTNATLVKYHTMDVTFPPGKDVIIEREYVATNGGSVRGDKNFSYTTETGGIWQGNIGKAEFTIRLDGWTVDDLAFDDGPQKLPPRGQGAFCSVNKADWKIISPTEMRLVWENFEPAVHASRRGIFLTTWVTDTSR